jgi:hypothetical protein
LSIPGQIWDWGSNAKAPKQPKSKKQHRKRTAAAKNKWNKPAKILETRLFGNFLIISKTQTRFALRASFLLFSD